MPTKMNKIKLAFSMIWLIQIFKDLPRRTALDEVLHDKAFNIAKNPKYDRYQRGLASMVYKIFDRRSNLLTDISALGGSIKNMLKQELANNHTKELLKS